MKKKGTTKGDLAYKEDRISKRREGRRKGKGKKATK